MLLDSKLMENFQVVLRIPQASYVDKIRAQDSDRGRFLGRHNRLRSMCLQVQPVTC